MNPFKRINWMTPISYFISVGIRCSVLFKDIIKLSYEWVQQLWLNICLQYFSDANYEFCCAEACMRLAGILHHICYDECATLLKLEVYHYSRVHYLLNSRSLG